jgi:hypothetical protein
VIFPIGKSSIVFIVLQVLYDANKIFWNFCVGQLGGVDNGEQFKKCSIYEVS